jgi:phage baseplate assembly protein W
MDLSDVEVSRIGRGMDLKNIFSSVSGKIEINEGVDRINQSIALILETSNGEVSMLPVVGSGVSELLFEPADDILKDKLELFVRDALEKLEPRIGVQGLNVDIEGNFVLISVDYFLTNTNISGRFDYEVTRLSRGDSVL